LVLNYLGVRVGLAMAGVRLGRRSPRGVAAEGTLISCPKGRYRDIDDRLKLGARHSAPCMDVPAKKVERLFGVDCSLNHHGDEYRQGVEDV
jgi:hypothetical protein